MGCPQFNVSKKCIAAFTYKFNKNIYTCVIVQYFQKPLIVSKASDDLMSEDTVLDD